MDRGEALRIGDLVRAWAPRLETRDARQARERLDDARDAIARAVTWALEHDPVLAATMIADGATYWVARGVTGPALAWAMRALDALPQPDVVRARLLATIVRLGGVRRDPGARRTFAQEALDLGLALGLNDVAIEALYELADPDGVAGAPLAVAVDALERVRRLEPATVRERAIVTDLEACVARRTAGPAAEAQILARGLGEARPAGLLRRMVHLGGNLADLQLSLGRTAEAGATAAEAALDAREIGDARQEARALDVLALVHVLDGDHARAGRALRRGLLLAVAADMPAAEAHALRAAALCAAAAGQASRASCLLGAADRVEVVGALDPEGGHPRLVRLLVQARTSIGPDAWERARARGAGMGSEEALRLADETADALLASTVAVRGVDLRLSPREIDVLTLLAEGLSDGDIGSRLFISRKTVSVHLTNVRAKTGARSRVALAVLARDLLGEPGAG